MKINIEYAKLKDVEKLLFVQNMAFYNDYEQLGDCPRYNLTYENMKNLVEKEDVFKILVDDKISGIIIVKNNGNGNFYLESLALVPEYQRMGIGGYALNYVLNAFKETTHWSLETPAKRIRNRHFYESFGFREMGRKLENDVEVIQYERFTPDIVKAVGKLFKDENELLAEMTANVINGEYKIKTHQTNSIIGGSIHILKLPLGCSIEKSFCILFAYRLINDNEWSKDSIEEYSNIEWKGVLKNNWITEYFDKEHMILENADRTYFWDDFISHISNYIPMQKVEKIYQKYHEAKIIKVSDSGYSQEYFGVGSGFAFYSEYGVYD